MVVSSDHRGTQAPCRSPQVAVPPSTGGMARSRRRSVCPCGHGRPGRIGLVWHPPGRDARRCSVTPRPKIAPLVLGFVLAGAGPAGAHEFWLAPSRYRAATSDSVVLGAFVGTGFRGEA